MPDGARSDDTAVQAQLDRLSLLSPGPDKLGLARIAALDERLGWPTRHLAPTFHVAGTNGKGSTCAYLRAMLEAAGNRVHVYTSPHLVRFNERIRIAGTLIDDARLAPLLERVIDASAGLEASFFEITTMAAFVAFAETPADACVIEVGLGGRLDATNILTTVVASGIASLGMDHEAFLGTTLAAIAGEKAGIMRAGVPCAVLAQPAEAMAVVEKHAAAIGTPLLVEARDWDIVDYPTALVGAHQRRNAGLATAMIRAQTTVRCDDRAIAAGLREARWPGRLQRLGNGPIARDREVWVDGAHNPDAAAAIAEWVAAKRPWLVLGMLANKDADGVLATLRPIVAGLTVVPVPCHVAHDPAALAARFAGDDAPDLLSALAAVPLGTPVLIAGSLYLAGAALRANRQFPD
jgi:dihydrofolate synthase/folylpolyglutamate synthase